MLHLHKRLEASQELWGQDSSHELLDMYLGYYGILTQLAGVSKIRGSSVTVKSICISCSVLF